MILKENILKISTFNTKEKAFLIIWLILYILFITIFQQDLKSFCNVLSKDIQDYSLFLNILPSIPFLLFNIFFTYFLKKKKELLNILNSSLSIYFFITVLICFLYENIQGSESLFSVTFFVSLCFNFFIQLLAEMSFCYVFFLVSLVVKPNIKNIYIPILITIFCFVILHVPEISLLLLFYILYLF